MDIIADFMTVIRNGCHVNKQEVDIRYSKLKCEMCRIMLEEGYIDNFQLDNPDQPKRIVITLKYDDQGNSVIRDLVRVSKPGRRKYVKADEIRPVHQGLGVAIISTSAGVLTDRQARERRMGGEYIGYIY